MESILSQIQNNYFQLNETIDLQNDLAKKENELVTLTIKYAHKEKENENLKFQLDAKNKVLSEKSVQLETKLEQLNSLNFHCNDLIQKHKFCLECMKNQADDVINLRNKNQELIVENEKLKLEKKNLQELFKNQIDELDLNLKNLVDENHDHLKTIKHLRQTFLVIQNELDGSNSLNKELQKTINELKLELKYCKDYNEGKFLTENEWNKKLNSLELALSKAYSKNDDFYLQISQLKSNLLKETKNNEAISKKCQYLKEEVNKFKFENENSLKEIKRITELFDRQKTNLKNEINSLNQKFEQHFHLTDHEKKLIEKQKMSYINLFTEISFDLTSQHKEIEFLTLSFKNQSAFIKELKNQIHYFKTKFLHFKSCKNRSKHKIDDYSLQIESLQKKFTQVEIDYLKKSEQYDLLEKEMHLNKNSFETYIIKISNLNAIITNKNEELILKDKTIEKLELIISQLKMELNNKNCVINERINQIENLDKNLKEEKLELDLKLANLELGLKSREELLNDRIEQIKTMNRNLDMLKLEKENVDFKLNQYENIINCQNTDIESKSFLIKQFEHKMISLKNEIKTYKDQLLKYESFKQDVKIFDHKQTQTNESECSNNLNIRKDETSRSESLNVGESFISDLKLNLKIKEDLVESINSSLVLKEAEIARLKTRISTMERKEILSNLVEENSNIENIFLE